MARIGWDQNKEIPHKRVPDKKRLVISIEKIMFAKITLHCTIVSSIIVAKLKSKFT